MEQFDLQVMLGDGSFADYQVKTERDSGIFQIYEKDQQIAEFTAGDDGSWTASGNTGLDEDLQDRIIEQLKGFRT